jgi:hypothetical protein
MSNNNDTIININININKYNNNLYELLYVSLDGKLNLIDKNLWINSTQPFDAIGSNIKSIASDIIVSKITQLNTGEFLFLGSNCNVYIMSSNFTNPNIISLKKFSSLTQLSDYRVLLTSKDGKMYIVDDITNFDLTIKEYFDDGTIYCMVKQTVDGYIVAIDGTQCGNAWRFELVDGKLINKTKINLDDTFTNRVSVFLPDLQNLLNLNCNSRYINRVYKYNYSDKTIKTKYDFRCGEDEEYETFNKKCYKKCPTGYKSTPGDIVSCWDKCNEGDIDVGALCRVGCKSGYNDVAGVCWNNKKLTYDVGVGTPPNYSCPTGYDLEGLRCIKDPPDGYKRLPEDYTTYWLKEPTSYIKDSKLTNLSCPIGYDLEGLRCIKEPPDGYKRLPGDYTTYLLKESISYEKNSKQANQDNSACDGLTARTSGLGTCSGVDECNTKTPVVCSKLCKVCTYDNYVYGCNADRCGREAEVCSGGVCIPGLPKCSKKIIGIPTKCSTDQCASRTPKVCSPGPAKCCANGLKTTLTGINCEKCGTYDSCTGGNCIGAIVTRSAPRSCPVGYNFDSGDPLKIGLCYEECRDGYTSRAGDIINCWNKKPTSIVIPLSNIINSDKSCPTGYKYDSVDPAKIGLCYEECRDGYTSKAADIISCWNKKPTSIVIPLSNVINATPSCNSEREYRDLMCYKKCDSGYIPTATNCSLPANDASYVPNTYAKKNIPRGNPSNPGIPASIECSDECCMFDLTFYNPTYIKPNNMVLPDIPITNGLVGFYNADSFGKDGVWYDLSSYNNNVTQLAGNFTKNSLFISGDVQTSILFPPQILPPTFTMFSIAKYNYKSQTNIQENFSVFSKKNSPSNIFSGSKGPPSVPKINIPSSGLPKINIPSSGLPKINIPSSGLPEINIPSSGVPETNIPSSGLPEINIPSSGVPETNIPSSGVPETNIPSSGVPEINIPSSGVPETNISSSGVPEINKQENNIGNILSRNNSSSNWFFGFNKGLSGVSARNKVITQTSLSAFDDKWVFSTDTNNMYRANRNNYTLDNINESNESNEPNESNKPNEPIQLSVNTNKDKSLYSDYSIGCIIVFNRTLSDSEISSVENWLATTYSNLLEQTYTKTFANLGYSCFDNKIGKVSDDYQNYIFATYNNGPLDCKWLNLPEKNNSFKPLKCNSGTNIQYEKFTNLNLFNIWNWENLENFVMYLLVIIIIIVLVCKKYNK